MLKRKQREIEDAEKVIEASKKSLKLEEDDISIRLSALASKEKVYDSLALLLVYFVYHVLE